MKFKNLPSIFLEDMIKTISKLKAEEKSILKEMSKREYMIRMRKRVSVEHYGEFYDEFIEICENEYDIENEEKELSDIVLSCNTSTQEYYNHNVEVTNQLINYITKLIYLHEIRTNQNIKDGEFKIESLEKIKLEKIQIKIFLDIKDVETLYGFSKTQQQGFRSRLRNPLPYIKESTKSKSANTKVQYKKQELENWIDNFL